MDAKFSCRWRAAARFALRVSLPLLACGVLFGQGGDYGWVIDEQLEAVRHELAGRGFSPVPLVEGDDSLFEGEAQVHALILDPWASYLVVAACDQDCLDIDLAVSDSFGDYLDRDFALDDLRTVVFDAGPETDFRLRVSMADCAVEPCFYGFDVYGLDDGDDYQAVVDGQLDAVGDVLADHGIHAVPVMADGGSLFRHEARVHSLALESSASYLVVGACDQDCADLDLAVSDGRGRYLDEDFELDDIPTVTFEVGRETDFRLRVSMADCAVEPCIYGFEVYLVDGDSGLGELPGRGEIR